MKHVVVVGSQWGDEGKGKIVDWLSSEADVIITFQGGHNAGHTLVIDGVTYKLRLLPSGIVRKNKISLIGNGVVIDPWALLEEIEEIKSKGVEVNENNLIISDSATLILPFHRELDEIREDTAGNYKTRRLYTPLRKPRLGGWKMTILRQPCVRALSSQPAINSSTTLDSLSQELHDIGLFNQQLYDLGFLKSKVTLAELPTRN